MPYPIPRHPYFKLGVRRSKIGLELYAMEKIPRGRFAMEYWGKVVTDDAAQYVGGKYLFELGNGRTILGATRKNTARYANHACRPNSEMRTIGNRAYLYSVKRIKPGEAITYDYGKEYFECFIKPYGCRCGTCKKRKTAR